MFHQRHHYHHHRRAESFHRSFSGFKGSLVTAIEEQEIEEVEYCYFPDKEEEELDDDNEEFAAIEYAINIMDQEGGATFASWIRDPLNWPQARQHLLRLSQEYSKEDVIIGISFICHDWPLNTVLLVLRDFDFDPFLIQRLLYLYYNSNNHYYNNNSSNNNNLTDHNNHNNKNINKRGEKTENLINALVHIMDKSHWRQFLSRWDFMQATELLRVVKDRTAAKSVLQAVYSSA